MRSLSSSEVPFAMTLPWSTTAMAAASRSGLVQVLGREQQGHAAHDEFADHFPDAQTAARVGPCRGLIQEQDPRVRQQAASQVNPGVPGVPREQRGGDPHRRGLAGGVGLLAVCGAGAVCASSLFAAALRRGGHVVGWSRPRSSDRPVVLRGALGSLTGRGQTAQRYVRSYRCRFGVRGADASRSGWFRSAF
jgi:hypothetical protein